MKAKWKYKLSEKGISFYYKQFYRGEIITNQEIPQQHRVEMARILLRIINSYIKDKENE